METFEQRQGESFLVELEPSAAVELVLDSVTDLRRPGQKIPSGVRQEPFEMNFRGPLEPLLPQRLYTLKSKDAECITLFIVPLGPSEGSQWYNVVVN